MEKTTIKIKFEHQGVQYEGWATPSDHHHEDGTASSYHVVLNMVMFGNLSLNQGKWVIDEQRPDELVARAGKCLDHYVIRTNRPPAAP